MTHSAESLTTFALIENCRAHVDDMRIRLTGKPDEEADPLRIGLDVIDSDLNNLEQLLAEIRSKLDGLVGE